jgi:hypothetical protein
VVIEDDVELNGLERLVGIIIPCAIYSVFRSDQMQPMQATSEGLLRLVGIDESLRRLEASGTPGCGLYGYLLTPAGAHKLIDAIRQDLCFGHVDWRVLRYCVTLDLVEKVIPGTRVAEILRNHHHWQPPAWGILRACTLVPRLTCPTWTSSRRDEQDQRGAEQAPLPGDVASSVFEGQTTVFCISNPHDYVQSFLVNGQWYEFRQLQIHRDLIAMGGTVVAVGSYVGNHTMFYARRSWAKLVYAIEPNPSARAVA